MSSKLLNRSSKRQNRTKPSSFRVICQESMRSWQTTRSNVWKVWLQKWIRLKMEMPRSCKCRVLPRNLINRRLQNRVMIPRQMSVKDTMVISFRIWRIKILHLCVIVWAKVSTRIKIRVRTKACQTTRLVVIIQFMWVRFYLIDMLSSRSLVGVIFQLSGWPRILSTTATWHLKFKRVHSTTWRQLMMRWIFWIRLPKTGVLKNGRSQFVDTTMVISIWWQDWTNLASFQRARTAHSCWTLSFITGLMGSILLWFLRFWGWTFWRLLKDTTIRVCHCHWCVS